MSWHANSSIYKQHVLDDTTSFWQVLLINLIYFCRFSLNHNCPKVKKEKSKNKHTNCKNVQLILIPFEPNTHRDTASPSHLAAVGRKTKDFLLKMIEDITEMTYKETTATSRLSSITDTDWLFSNCSFSLYPSFPFQSVSIHAQRLHSWQHRAWKPRIRVGGGEKCQAANRCHCSAAICGDLWLQGAKSWPSANIAVC